jgi:tRNA modification GTPase
LFNALVERFGVGASGGAIVSPIPGATRDFVVARIQLKATPCELIDTAGAMDPAGEAIAEAAQNAAAGRRQQAALELACIDAQFATGELVRATRCGVRDNDIVVLTKSDLCQNSAMRVDERLDPKSVVRCSSATGRGIGDLAALVSALVSDHAAGGQTAVAATSSRCAGSLSNALAALDGAIDLVDVGAEELIAAEIRAALDALGEVVGAVCSDDILDKIFSQFCIGK